MERYSRYLQAILWGSPGCCVIHVRWWKEDKRTDRNHIVTTASIGSFLEWEKMAQDGELRRNIESWSRRTHAYAVDRPVQRRPSIVLHALRGEGLEVVVGVAVVVGHPAFV